MSIIEKYLSIDTEALIQPANSKISLPKAIEAFSSHRMTLKPKKKQRGIMELLGLRSDTPFDSELSPLLKCFDFAENNQGILPLFVRVLQNNYQGSIKKFRFVRERNSLYLISREGEKEYSYEIGIYGYKFTELEYEKEKYTVGALVSYMGKENGKRKYRIEFIFPELANKRSIELILDEKDRLQVKMSEFPDSKIAGTFISSIPAMNPKIGFAISLLESNLGKNFIEKRLSELFSPTLFAIYENSEEREAFLSRENERINEKLASMGMVKMMINSFFGRENEENTPQKPSSLGGLLFSAMLGGLFSKKKEQTEITNE